MTKTALFVWSLDSSLKGKFVKETACNSFLEFPAFEILKASHKKALPTQVAIDHDQKYLWQ